MAKFLGNGIVWDAARNKELCSFVAGAFVTDDQRTIDLLRSLNYVEEHSTATVLVPVPEEFFDEPKEETPVVVKKPKAAKK
jgi:hypothetical protein